VNIYKRASPGFSQEGENPAVAQMKRAVLGLLMAAVPPTTTPNPHLVKAVARFLDKIDGHV
jgi:hypothetical protein